jgi:putative ABC transport system permease protein
MDAFWQDIRYGLRLLAKSPGFTAIAVVALGLGIGANASMFSVADGMLLRPVNLPDLDHIAIVQEIAPQQTTGNTSVALANYVDWKHQSTSFTSWALFQDEDVRLTGTGTPLDLQGMNVSANFFDLLGVKPALGRTFSPDEEQPGHEREAILSYGLWTRQFGSDPNIAGKSIQLEGKTYTIVGVMAKTFDFPTQTDVWFPLARTPADWTSRTTHSFTTVTRLKPGVSYAQAQTEMSLIAKRLSDAYPDTNRNWRARVRSINRFLIGDDTRQYILMLMVAVGFVLLIACANVANLLFARSSGRQKELAVRLAMGAGRARIVRQLLVESVLLSLGGAALGLLLAKWGVHLILAPMPPDVAKSIAGWDNIQIDTRALIYTISIGVLAGIVAGVAPAFHNSSVDLNETLKESGRGSSVSRSRQRMRSALVVIEVALSLILLIGAGLMVKGFRALLDVNQGFQPASVLTTLVRLSGDRYKDMHPRADFYDRTLVRLKALPGVQSAAVVTGLPYSDNVGSNPFGIEGQPVTDLREVRHATNIVASREYFRMLNIPLRAGREFTESDGENSPLVAVVSETLARRFFPRDNPIGHKIRFGLDSATNKNRWFTVIGIVGDILYDWGERMPEPTIYRYYRQSPQNYTSFVLRTTAPPMQLAEPVRQVIAQVDPEEPAIETKTFQQVIKESVIGIAYVAVMMAVFGFIALLLASVGVYGVMAYSVSERTHEIGIRMALGAAPRDVLRMIVGRGLLLTTIGAAIGVPIAFVLARMLSSLIYGVTPGDIPTYSLVCAALGFVALVACYFPARRATRVDPLIALRYE